MRQVHLVNWYDQNKFGKRQKELLKTRKRVNDFKLKHIKIMNEQNAVKEQEGEDLLEQ